MPWAGGGERQRVMLEGRKRTPYAKPTSVKGQQTCDRYRMGLGPDPAVLQQSGTKGREKRGVLSSLAERWVTPPALEGDDMGNATGHRFDNVRPVLVPVDPARDAAEVAGAAAEVCAGLGAKAVLLDVKRSPDGMQREVRISGGTTVAAVLEDGACAHLKVLAGIFRAEGVPVDLAVREGDVVGNIVAEAVDTCAQLIVMGSRTPAEVVCERQATVLDEVIRFSEVPVMVVNADPTRVCQRPDSVLRLGSFKKVY